MARYPFQGIASIACAPGRVSRAAATISASAMPSQDPVISTLASAHGVKSSRHPLITLLRYSGPSKSSATARRSSSAVIAPGWLLMSAHLPPHGVLGDPQFSDPALYAVPDVCAFRLNHHPDAMPQ